MPKEAVFTLKLEPELREAFMAAATASDRPASQIVRELMRDYVLQQRAGGYDVYLRSKIKTARVSARAGRGLPMTRLRPNSPAGAPGQPGRRESRLDARGATRPR